MPEYNNYQSPFTWRYASPEMRALWSEEHKRLLWRQIWVALAKAQSEFGLVTTDQLADLEAHVAEIDVTRALEIESEIHHDLMAELKTFAEQCPLGGGILHLGATSMDVEDNADVLRLREALNLVLGRLKELLLVFAQKIESTAELPVMAFTHIQPAEPTTLGYRLASYAQDLLEDWIHSTAIYANLRGKGFKGAVGTAAAYGDLIGVEQLEIFEARLSQLLNLPFYPIATQTYPRKQDFEIVSALAGLGGSLYKLAFDLRLLQSPPIGEISEPFGKKQVGSSAMPFKRNPINAEKIDSLARALSVMPQIAWGNAAHSLLERTLDDSANRRTMLPEAFLIVDELLKTALRIIDGLNIHEASIQKNLDAYAPFAATERIMMAAVKTGADRQDMHERLREHALAAWQDVQMGLPNPLKQRIKQDDSISKMLSEEEIEKLFDVSSYVGSAPQRARDLASRIRNMLE